MFDYLQQFNKLPKDLRDQVSSLSAMAVITELESKYKVDLAATVMKVMVKSIAIKELSSHLVSESGLTPEAAGELAREMREKIFMSVASYLGLDSEQRALDLDKDISFIIKEIGLVLPSAVMVGRFKNILATYLRGVRSKIDTRNSLAKDAKIGGLNLSPEEIDRVLKTCSTYKFSNLTTSAVQPDITPVKQESASIISKPKAEVLAVPPRLAEIMAQADQSNGYDLKQALASRSVKSSLLSPKIDTSHELNPPKAQLDLPRPKVATPVSVVKASTPTPPALVVESSKQHLNKLSFFDKAAKLMSLSQKDKIKIPKPLTPIVTPIQPAVSKAPVVKPAQPIKVATKPVNLSQAGTAASRPVPAPSPRPVMHDIKPMPKVMGPIEELQFLDLVNFRRLGSDSGEAVNKIFAKIKLLEKDGYDRMVLGVKAWRQSPVNHLYLRLGQEAIAKGQPFKEILAAKKKAGLDSLSPEEISAIISLNSKLIF